MTDRQQEEDMTEDKTDLGRIRPRQEKLINYILSSKRMLRRVVNIVRRNPFNTKDYCRAFSTETISVDVGDAYTTHCKFFCYNFRFF